MTSSAIVLLALIAIAWLILMADLPTVVGATSIGDRDIFLGLRWIVAGILVGVIWLCLSGMFLIAGGQDVTPAWGNVAAMVLMPLSGAAALAGLYLVSEANMRWPLVVPVLTPLLLAAYFISLYRPGWSMAPMAIWGVVAVITLSVVPFVTGHLNAQAAAKVQNTVSQKEWEVQEKARVREENLAKLAALSTDQHMADWLGVLSDEGGVRAEAITKFRTAARRQGDVEEGLGYGIPAFMRFVPELDLQPTQKLCEAGQAYLMKTAKGYRLKDREPFPYEANRDIDEAIPGIQWFQAHGCNCDEGIGALRAVVMTYLDSPARQKLLANLPPKP